MDKKNDFLLPYKDKLYTVFACITRVYDDMNFYSRTDSACSYGVHTRKEKAGVISETSYISIRIIQDTPKITPNFLSNRGVRKRTFKYSRKTRIHQFDVNSK